MKFFTQCDRTRAQGAQGSCGCPVPLSVQGQAGWGLEQPGPGVLAHGRDLELDDLKSPFQPKPL